MKLSLNEKRVEIPSLSLSARERRNKEGVEPHPEDSARSEGVKAAKILELPSLRSLNPSREDK